MLPEASDAQTPKLAERSARAYGSWLCSWWLACCIVRGETYRLDVWKTDDGLPQSSVNSILQSRDGYLWVATFGGLVRFDGVRFKTYDTGPLRALSERRIVSVYQDQHDATWAGTEDGDVLKFAGTNLQVYTPPSQGKASKLIRAFGETSDGAVWMQTAEGLLLRHAGGEFSIISSNWNLTARTANSICVDRAGQLWVGTDKELAQWQNGEFKSLWNQSSEDNFNVEALAPSPQGGVWVAGAGRLRRFVKNKWTTDLGPYPWSKGVLSCLLEDSKGQLWVGTYGSGLFYYFPEGRVTRFENEQGLPGKLIKSLWEDRESNLWVGTEGLGLARLKPAVFQSFGRAQGLSSDMVLTVCEGVDDELWIGTNGDGINRLKNGQVTYYGPKQGLTNECVWSLLQDHKKQLWAGTWGGGLFKMEEDRFVRFSADACGPVVCGLFEDSKSRLWLGQVGNEPAVTYLRDDKSISLPLPTKSALVDVRAMVEGSAGNIWIGTRGDGLYCLGEADGNGSPSGCLHLSRKDGLVSDSVLALYCDREGILWVGTRKGLTRMQKGSFTSFTTTNGLPNEAICFITEDDNGYFWFGSGSGVFRVARQQFTDVALKKRNRVDPQAYTQADGLPGLECSSGCQPAGLKTRDGRIWFPTVSGLAVVDPAHVPFNTSAPPVLIEEVVIEEKDHSTLFEVQSALESNFKPALLKVPPGKSRFEFRYTGLSFTAPEKVQFKYQLEGLEHKWVEANTLRTATYSYLPPGRYRFHVLACNNDGIWNEAGASLSLILLPHFWQTWWFKILGAGLVLLLFVGGYEIRLATERRLTRMRLRIARDLHDEVGSNLGSIALLGEVIPKQHPGTAEDISEIRRIALQTIESLRDIVWFLNPANDNLNDLILRMKETSRTMLTAIPFEFRSPDENSPFRPSLEMRRNLFPMFKEMLHNVVKHSSATRVKIAFEVAPRSLLLRVTDNGIGFDEAAVRTGNGLKNLRRRAADFGATIEINSQPGKGTTIIVKTPIT